MTRPVSLSEQVIAATGLSQYLAPFVVRRVCAMQGFVAQSMTQKDLSRALPSLLEALRVYLTPEALARAEVELSRLAGHHAPSSEA